MKLEKSEALSFLKIWEIEHGDAQKLMDNLKIGLGAIHPENHVFKTVWQIFESYTQALELALGDSGGWMSFYKDENAMGRNGLEAGYDGKTKPIKTLNDLLELIQESHTRA